ncbi:MAG: hypothetical protein ACWGOX_14115 [Desulforhopalus sp.]
MMKTVITVTAICCLLWTVSATAMDSMSSDKTSHQDHGAMAQTKTEAMDHSSMNHGSSQEGGTFKHAEMVDGIHAEFQVMDLASMNMSDPEGRSHHVMVSFVKNDSKIEKAVGKVKLIAPSGKEQTADLQDFGNGVFAANFTIDEPGKWGVICLFKDNDGKHTVKFWYPHQTM